jgi:hypothetical protein
MSKGRNVNKPHPALVRAFVQTNGPDLLPTHKIMRDYLDQVDSVDWIGCGCFKMRDHEGRQVGIIQFQPPWADEVDDRVEEVVRAVVAGLQPPPDVLAGDTVIRSLDARRPEDVAIVKRAADGGGVVSGVDVAELDPRLGAIPRVDAPPLDLPDYDPGDYDHSAYDWTKRQGIIWGTVLAVAAAVAFAMAYHFGVTSHG